MSSTILIGTIVGLSVLSSIGISNLTYAAISLLCTYMTNIAYRADYQSLIRIATERYKPTIAATLNMRIDKRFNNAITLLGIMTVYFTHTVFLYICGFSGTFWLQQLLTFVHLFTAIVEVLPRKYDFFICHHQGSGGLQARSLSDDLEKRGHTVWLDNKVDRSERTLDGMRRGVQSSSNIIVILTGRYEINNTGIPCGSDSNGATYQSPFSRWFCHEELKTARAAGVKIMGVQETDERFSKPSFGLCKASVVTGHAATVVEANLKLLDDICFIPLHAEEHERPAMLLEIERQADGGIFQEGNALSSTLFDTIDALREKYRDTKVFGFPLLRPVGTAFSNFFSTRNETNWEQHGSSICIMFLLFCFWIYSGFHSVVSIYGELAICDEVRKTVCPRKRSDCSKELKNLCRTMWKESGIWKKFNP